MGISNCRPLAHQSLAGIVPTGMSLGRGGPRQKIALADCALAVQAGCHDIPSCVGLAFLALFFSRQLFYSSTPLLLLLLLLFPLFSSSSRAQPRAQLKPGQCGSGNSCELVRGLRQPINLSRENRLISQFHFHFHFHFYFHFHFFPFHFQFHNPSPWGNRIRFVVAIYCTVYSVVCNCCKAAHVENVPRSPMAWPTGDGFPVEHAVFQAFFPVSLPPFNPFVSLHKPTILAARCSLLAQNQFGSLL
ncbi:unnamed protein product [Protopolystoma xenopodis]|uniref:Uncharacterized protein n=1 Tax=Protopolystoma xenopodis TaxID=117903 RepID=A0A3S5AJ76_9PLAT|nr:unnamed protein product [Protopolystoma xenopodis]